MSCFQGNTLLLFKLWYSIEPGNILCQCCKCTKTLSLHRDIGQGPLPMVLLIIYKPSHLIQLITSRSSLVSFEELLVFLGAEKATSVAFRIVSWRPWQRAFRKQEDAGSDRACAQSGREISCLCSALVCKLFAVTSRLIELLGGFCSVMPCNDTQSHFVQGDTSIFWIYCGERSPSWWASRTTQSVWERVCVACICVLSSREEGNGIICSDQWSWKLPVRWFDKQQGEGHWGT